MAFNRSTVTESIRQYVCDWLRCDISNIKVTSIVDKIESEVTYTYVSGTYTNPEGGGALMQMDFKIKFQDT